MKFDKKKILESIDRDRKWFNKKWAVYVREHDDKDWSKQQALIINSQLKGKQLTRKQYLKLKKEPYNPVSSSGSFKET